MRLVKPEVVADEPRILELGRGPTIDGSRITVYDVLDWLADGMSTDEIVSDFPELTPEDIKACIAFAADRERKLVAGG